MKAVPSAISELELKSWSQLLRAFHLLDVGDPFEGHVYLFRGHASASWPLEPTLHRSARQPGRTLPSAAELIHLETYVTSQVRALAPCHLNPATIESTHAPFDWWTVMRHHGAPSRLLDWTTSFFVAAYFCAIALPDEPGAIYSVHAHTLAQAMNAAYPELAGIGSAQLVNRALDASAPPMVLAVERRKAKTDRMIAQQGVFMYCLNVAGDVEAEIARELPKVADPKKETLHRFIVAAAAKGEIVRRLRAMNVTAHTLFPGLDGIGRHLDDLMRWR